MQTTDVMVAAPAQHSLTFFMPGLMMMILSLQFISSIPVTSVSSSHCLSSIHRQNYFIVKIGWMRWERRLTVTVTSPAFPNNYISIVDRNETCVNLTATHVKVHFCK